MGFTIADGKIWIRCFQISETAVSKSEKPTDAGNDENEDPDADGKGKSTKTNAKVKGADRGETKISLVEIGPRFVLTPIVILESSFGGPVIYENKEFVSPNQIRSEIRQSKAGRYNRRAESGIESRAKRGDLGLRTGTGKKKGELDDSVLFA